MGIGADGCKGNYGPYYTAEGWEKIIRSIRRQYEKEIVELEKKIEKLEDEKRKLM